MDEKEILDASLLIERILTYGVNLGDLTRKESEDYLLDLCQFVNKEGLFRATFQDNKVIVESISWNPVAAIRVHKSTLQIAPLSENSFFDMFVAVLGFVASKNSIKQFIDEISPEDDDLCPDKPETDEFDWI